MNQPLLLGLPLIIFFLTKNSPRDCFFKLWENVYSFFQTVALMVRPVWAEPEKPVFLTRGSNHREDTQRHMVPTTGKIQRHIIPTIGKIQTRLLLNIWIIKRHMVTSTVQWRYRAHDPFQWEDPETPGNSHSHRLFFTQRSIRTSFTLSLFVFFVSYWFNCVPLFGIKYGKSLTASVALFAI
jgi:hypothetical protein